MRGGEQLASISATWAAAARWNTAGVNGIARWRDSSIRERAILWMNSSFDLFSQQRETRESFGGIL